MGRDKAFLMGSAVAAAVREAAGTAILVGDPARYASLGYPVIPDLWPGEGPLAGIVAALRHTASDGNLIVACDMPMVSAGFLKQLLDAWTGGILAPVNPAGYLEPLCAVYGRDALPGLETAFLSGVRKVAAAFERLPLTRYPVAEPWHFQNINTPEEWACYDAQ